MANVYGTNPIKLDTSAAAVDIGDVLFGQSDAYFYIDSIEWQNPATGETAEVTDNNGNPIYSQTFATGDACALVKNCGGRGYKGLKLAQNALGGGELLITLR